MKVFTLSYILMSMTCAFFKVDEKECSKEEIEPKIQEKLRKDFHSLWGRRRDYAYFPTDKNSFYRVVEVKDLKEYKAFTDERSMFNSIAVEELEDILPYRSIPCFIKHDDEATWFVYEYENLKNTINNIWNGEIDYSAREFWSADLDEFKKIIDILILLAEKRFYFKNLDNIFFGEFYNGSIFSSFKLLDAKEIKIANPTIIEESLEQVALKSTFKHLPELITTTFFMYYKQDQIGLKAEENFKKYFKEMKEKSNKLDVITEKDYYQLIQELKDEFKLNKKNIESYRSLVFKETKNYKDIVKTFDKSNLFKNFSKSKNVYDIFVKPDENINDIIDTEFLEKEKKEREEGKGLQLIV